MRVPEAVKTLRADFGESQQAFSNRLGIALNSVSRYETGEHRPSPSILVKLGQLARAKGREDLFTVFAWGSDETGELGQIGREMMGTVQRLLSDAKSELDKLDASKPALNLSDEQKAQLNRAYDSVTGGLDFIKQILAD